VIRAIALLVAVSISGCVSWRPYEAGPSLAAREHLPTRLRTTRQDSTRVILTAPFVVGDTLYGRVDRDTVGVPMKEVSKLEWERLSAGRTAGLLLGVPAGLTLIYVAMCDDTFCGATY
jgi:hypothetical protein